MQLCQKPLKQNPFFTYRDPITGRWLVIYPDEIQEVPQTADSPQPVSLR
jgi:hypothetical protein